MVLLPPTGVDVREAAVCEEAILAVVVMDVPASVRRCELGSVSVQREAIGGVAVSTMWHCVCDQQPWSRRPEWTEEWNGRMRPGG